MNGRKQNKYWSASVTRMSNALDLETKVFTWSNPRRIALSLKRSAQHSGRRKAGPFKSAMSLLNFYLNRAGRALPVKQRHILMLAKEELRQLFHEPPRSMLRKKLA